jgi:hypothetical protein
MKNCSKKNEKVLFRVVEEEGNRRRPLQGRRIGNGLQVK